MLSFVQAWTTLRTVGVLDKIRKENLSCEATAEREQDHSKLYLILAMSAGLLALELPCSMQYFCTLMNLALDIVSFSALGSLTSRKAEGSIRKIKVD